MRIFTAIFYGFVKSASIIYITISSLLCIIWVSNYPMENCIQYILPNMNIWEYSQRLNSVLTEGEGIGYAPKSDERLKYCNSYSFDELMVSHILFKDANIIYRLEAIEHQKDIVLRLGSIYFTNPDDEDFLRTFYLPIGDYSIKDVIGLGNGTRLDRAFEERLLKKMGTYHKDRLYSLCCLVVIIFNHHFLHLLLGYILSVFLFCWSFKMQNKKWKISGFLLLTVVPFIVISVSLLLSYIGFYRGKNVFDAQNRGIYEEGTDIHPLTFLIVRNNPVSDYLDEHQDIDVDCPDAVYGNSLLMFAIIHNSKISAKELLEHQANPNYVSPYSGGTPLLKSLQVFDYYQDPDTTLLSLMLSFGADANLITYDKRHKRNRFPLLEVRSMEQARLLVEKGGAQITQDIIDNMYLIKYVYPFMNDSIHEQIIKYYKSFSQNNEE